MLKKKPRSFRIHYKSWLLVNFKKNDDGKCNMYSNIITLLIYKYKKKLECIWTYVLAQRNSFNLYL